MKKPLLLAATFAAAFSASAQSSVTLFGVVDATLSRGTGSVADRTQMLRGGLSSNRLGFRGTEDLGEGMSAQFWLEAGMNLDDGSGQPTNTNNQNSGATTAGGLTFARRSTVGLASNWGEIRLGRDFVPQYGNMVLGDPFGNVGVGSAVNYTAIITGSTNTRASNMISYFTPRSLGGFSVHVAHYLGENASNAPNADDGRGTGIRVGYDSGPFSAGVAWGRTDYAASDAEQRNVGASWNFGVVKVMGTYNSDKAGALHAKGVTVGVIAPVGPGELKAAYSQHKTDAAGEPGAKKFAVGYVHNLSKRTALYGTFARLKNSGGATMALNGAQTAPNTSSNGLDIGIRHSF